MMAEFEAAGFIPKAMRTTEYGNGAPRIARLDVIGHLTVAGEAHRARLSGYAE